MFWESHKKPWGGWVGSHIWENFQKKDVLFRMFFSSGGGERLLGDMLGLLSAALAGASQVPYIMMVMVMVIVIVIVIVIVMVKVTKCWACLLSAALAGAS